MIASPGPEAWKWGGVFHQHKVQEAIYLNGGTFACEWWRSLWASEALTNWSNQLTVVCCVCVWLRQPMSACLCACFQWVRQVLFCCSWPAHSINLSFPPLSPTHTRHTNKWKNDRTLKNFFSCKTTCEAIIHGMKWNSPVSLFCFFGVLLTKICPSDKLVSVVHTPHSST